MNKNIGQNTEVWSDYWGEHNPIREIQKWDFFGTRQWITKYVPRNGKVLEAGCGLGKWVFYLSEFGIDIEGLDFSENVIDNLNKWKSKYNYSTDFNVGDVKKLPYQDNSLSGYISLGVIEHFIEGPEKPLKEAYRVLRPGGIAIITTPSISWYISYKRIKVFFKNSIKKIIKRKVTKKPFFQYEYTPKVLRKFVSKSGLLVTKNHGFDLLYTFTELGEFKGHNIKKGTFGYWFSHKFEKTCLSKFGGQSIVIAVKIANKMHCFNCGELNAKKSSLDKYDVPICSDCSKQNKKTTNFYLKNNIPYYSLPYIIDPEIINKNLYLCEYCSTEYISNKIFENYGFSKKVCAQCLKNNKINIQLSNSYTQPIWRK